MKMVSTIKMLVAFVILFLGILIGINYALADPVMIYDPHHFRDIRSPNTVNWYEGDRLVIGASAEPAIGTTVEACQDGTCIDIGLIGDIVDPYEFSRSISYDPLLTGIWVITATNGPDSDTTESHAVGDIGPLPFVRNARIVGTGLTPTIRWDLPVDNTEPFTNLQVGIIDDVTNGRLYFSPFLPPSTTEYTLPGGLLNETGRYTIRVMLTNRLTGKEVNRATTFINFRPLPDGSPPEVYIPVVDYFGVFTFDCDVEQDVPVFIDPEVAIGYDYAIGVVDTIKFASVTLPEVGDNLFDLYLFDGSEYYLAEENLPSGQTYHFASEGVEQFRVLGIAEEDMLNPNDTLAFITELTFTGTGQFTGSMTPIVTYTPIPGDFEPDGDVDGFDLAFFFTGVVDISPDIFASNYGRTEW